MFRDGGMTTRTTPDLLLRAYACGLFPMAESRDSPELFWVDPERRGVLPFGDFHIPRRLARTVRQELFEIAVDRDFRAVLEACAAPARGRDGTWINGDILMLYEQLYAVGAAHSVECRRDGALVGGLYGVSLAGAFFGESMFHRARDASKVALVHLVARLRAGGYTLLDTQFLTDHLARFGAREVSRAAYRRLLATALAARADFHAAPPTMSGETALELAGGG